MAWAYAPLMAGGLVVTGPQSVPAFRLPLMIAAQRKFSFDSALVDFTVTRRSVHVCVGGGGQRIPTGGLGGGAADTKWVPGLHLIAYAQMAVGINMRLHASS